MDSTAPATPNAPANRNASANPNAPANLCAAGARDTAPRTKRIALVLLMLVQAGSAAFFALDLLKDLIDAPVSKVWELHNDLELLANLGLVAAIFVEGHVLRRMLQREAKSARTLQAAQGAMADLLAQRFEEWGFTASEADVARFTIKGFSIAEVAGLRGSSEATVKAHLNAVYRKAGVQGRGQLVASFVEDLFVTA